MATTLGPLKNKPAAEISAVISGTAIYFLDEQEIEDGGETIIITLTGGTWVASGATFEAIRQDIINGLDSAQSEANGWNAEVRDNLAVTTVVRTSATVVTITLSAQASYAITTKETITVTIPASAISGSSEVVANPQIEAWSISDEYTVALAGGGGSRDMLLSPDSSWTPAQVNAMAKNGRVKGLTSGIIYDAGGAVYVDWPEGCDTTYRVSYAEATWDSIDPGACSANFTDYIRNRFRDHATATGQLSFIAHPDRAGASTYWGDLGFINTEKARYLQ